MRHERKLILLFCAVAAIRVFIFSAAFPFFNNVDEQAHVDLVMRYARGDLPRELGHYSSEAAYYISLYGSPEFFMAPEQFETNEFPPPNWTLPTEQRKELLNTNSAWWRSNENHESGEPPLYYWIAGLWLNLARTFGITGAWLLYWVRFLNVFAAAALVWTGYVAAKLVFPDRQFIDFSVPILLGVWPQSTFYSIQSDLLSPLCFGIAFVGLIKFLRDDPTSLSLAIWTGLALAATCLTKTANIALLLVGGIALIFKIRNLAQRRTLRPRLVSLAILIGSAAVPIALWFAWNVHTFGDLTASNSKIDFLGWTRKPVSNWWPHPIFTLNGVKEFWPQLMASFWRGELIWHGKRLAFKANDTFYWISSTLAIGVAVFSLFPRLTKLTEFQRESLWLAFSTFAVLVVFVALLSIAFDFGVCPYPSREHPYFISGRLLSAAAVPFFLVYSYALDRALSWIPRAGTRMILCGALALFIVVSQCAVDWSAFSSRYNFFHL
jgi:multidrug transporter EmrE-like cation transporter